jgi:UDP-glucose 4-epimerase
MRLQGKTLLVIGGAGLIGSHTVDALLAEDVAEIRVFDNFSRGRRENLAAALKDPRVNVFADGGDILQRDVLDAAMRGVDGVFHFAALWLLHCQEYPRSAFEVNVGGAFNVFEASIRNKVQRLVFSSSASVYGDAIHEPMGEDHPFNNRNLYGATKICGEALARAMHHGGGLPYVALRYMNVYGPRADYKGAYVAVIMRMLDVLEQGDSPVVEGDGTESFDFVSVRDCARANVAAMKADTVDRVYNVGTGVATSLDQLARTLMQLTGRYAQIRYVPGRGRMFVRSRIGDQARARAEIGFAAETNLRTGLEELIAWRRAQP